MLEILWEVEQERDVMMASTNVMGFRWLEHSCFADNRHPWVLLATGMLLPLHFGERKAA